MVFLKSLGQKYFSIPSDGDETGAVAVVPISGSDDVWTIFETVHSKNQKGPPKLLPKTP